MEYDAKFLERYWAKVDKTDQCWLWTATTSTSGYGRMDVKGKMTMAHRISLEIALGRSIGDGLFVAHLPVVCHNKLCVNPAHLREATRSENQKDRRLDGTHHKPGTKRHYFTEEKIRAIRTDERLLQIIADENDATVPMISMIKNRKTYCWVED